MLLRVRVRTRPSSLIGVVRNDELRDRQRLLYQVFKTVHRRSVSVADERPGRPAVSTLVARAIMPAALGLIPAHGL